MTYILGTLNPTRAIKDEPDKNMLRFRWTFANILRKCGMHSAEMSLFRGNDFYSCHNVLLYISDKDTLISENVYA